jgi:hypothetical protein
MSLDAILQIASGTALKQVRLLDYLDAEAEEAASADAYGWIKALRHATVDGESLRQRFTYRGDSLWWFAELYLHKERAILTLFRAIRAADNLIERERPLTISCTAANRTVQTAVCGAAAARGTRCSPSQTAAAPLRVAMMDARSAALAAAALASPGRPASLPNRRGATVAAFIHRAFWKATAADDGSAESYIGPVLHALEARLPAGAIQYVGVGPATNFRARRWWTPSAGRPTSRVVPVEQLVPRSALRGSWQLWKDRHAVRRALRGSDDIRRAAIIRKCDCWPIVAEALDGIALLQFPWSARAMDEAGASLDALEPQVALTYAEAGGWGRALALEARRRGVPLAGLQHGFIYRHWLNYRHEPDEMLPRDGTADAGFPRPTLTLVFDEYAAGHLASAARFPPDAIAVTGSPRLDAMAAEAAALSDDAIAGVRRDAGAAGSEALVVVVSKYTEIRPHLPALVDALRRLPDVRAVIKTHPAETPAPYEAAAAGAANIRVLPAASPLAPLLRAAHLVVTVNSTLAIDALVLGVPALVIGLPNNLTPFVDSGAMAGAAAPGEIGTALNRVLYDQGFRQQLAAAASAVTARYRMTPDGRAAERSAEAILRLAK